MGREGLGGREFDKLIPGSRKEKVERWKVLSIKY